MATGTATDQGMGVFGQADRGSGVVGVSVAWIGVYGESAEFQGVRGTSKNKDHAGVVGTNEAGGPAFYGDGGVGLQGVGKTWVGVYGETQAVPDVGAAGIWGDGKNGGDGVKGHASGPGKAGVAGFHLTSGGPGIYGEGAPAGRFKGDVEITGALSVAGIGFAALLAQLAMLQDQVASLTSRVGALEAKVGTTSIPATGSPTIGVSQIEGRRIKVEGSNFKKNAAYRIRVVVGAVGNETHVDGASGGAGGFSHTVPIGGVPVGTPMWISATDFTPDANITGVLWSNTVPLTAV